MKPALSSGFTLIELLVVVLIIGILAAVALPQYKLAVAKTRLATLLPMGRTLQQAQARYYLANGSFAADIRDLDVTCSAYGTGAHEKWCYLSKDVYAHLEGTYIVFQDSRVPSVLLLFFYTSSGTYSALCYAYRGTNEDFANRVCKSLSGLDQPTGDTGAAQTYRLWR